MSSRRNRNEPNRHESWDFTHEIGHLDFKRLGLSSSECRAAIIRQAASKRARRVWSRKRHAAASATEVANIASSTYRLLDPRRRANLVERIQLCFPLDREDRLERSHPTLAILNPPEGGWITGREIHPDEENASALSAIEPHLPDVRMMEERRELADAREIVRWMQADRLQDEAMARTRFRLLTWTLATAASILIVALFAYSMTISKRPTARIASSDISSIANKSGEQEGIVTEPVSMQSGLVEQTQQFPAAPESEGHDPQVASSPSESVHVPGDELEVLDENQFEETSYKFAAAGRLASDSLIRFEGPNDFINWGKPFTLEVKIAASWGLEAKQWLFGDVELLPSPEGKGVQVTGWQAWLEPIEPGKKRALFLATSTGVQIELPPTSAPASILGITSDGTSVQVWLDGRSIGEFRVQALLQGFKQSSQPFHLLLVEGPQSAGELDGTILRAWSERLPTEELAQWRRIREPSDAAQAWVTLDETGLWLDLSKRRHRLTVVGLDRLPAIQQTQVQSPAPRTLPESSMDMLSEVDLPIPASSPFPSSRASRPDEATLKTSRERLQRVLKDKLQAAKQSADARRQVTVELAQLVRESEVGSADRFAILEAMISNALEDGGLLSALRLCDRLEAEFDLSVWNKRTELFELQSKRTQTMDGSKEIAILGSLFSERAIREEAFDAANDLIRIAVLASNRVNDDALKFAIRKRRDELSLARRRSASGMKGASRLKDAPDDPSANLEYGIYLALIKNDWDRAAQPLSRCSDVKWRKIGEFESSSPSDGDQQQQLAMALIDMTSSLKGREADLVRLRAIEWLEKAVAQARGITRAELEDMLKKQKDVLPPDRQLADIEKYSSNKLPSQSSTAEDWCEQPAVEMQGMLGRILVNGVDAGVLLRYEPEIELSDAQIQDILSNVNRRGEQVRVELSGVFALKQAGTVYFTQRAGSANAGFGQLSVDGKVLGQTGGQDDPETASYKVHLDAGEYLVVWTLTGAKIGSCKITCRVSEAQHPITLGFTPLMLSQLRSVPTTLRVNLIRSKERK